MTPRTSVACAFVLSIAAVIRSDARDVRVTAPDGTIDRSARVACVDPVSTAVAVDPRGHAAIADTCRRVRCESARWLYADAAASAGALTCALRPAAGLVIELPKDAGDTLRLLLSTPGSAAPGWDTTLPARPAMRRSESPPLALGKYDVAVQRADGSWSCRTQIRLARPETKTVFVPWREPRWLAGRVVTSTGEPLAQVPIATFTDPPAGTAESWSCQASPHDVRSLADGGFKTAVDPALETLVVAGGWADPRGLAAASRREPWGGTLILTPVMPHHVTARVLDEDDRPVRCRASLAIDDRDLRWAARVVPGAPKEAVCRSDGTLELGPSAADTFEVDVRPENALPVRVPGAAAHGVAAVDLGIIRVERGVALRVDVTGPAQRPVVGADVEVVSRRGLVVTRQSKTGDDGVATVTGLPPTVPVGVTVKAAGYARFERDAVPPEGKVAVTLDPIDALRGRVVDGQGHAVSGRVRVSGRDGTPVDETETDSSGSFSLTSLPEGVVLIRAEAPGFKPSAIARISMRAQDRPKELVLAVQDDASLHGTVFDPSHAPVPGATVVLVREGLQDPPEAGASASTQSAIDGSFELSSAGVAGERVVAVAEGYAAAMARPGSSDAAPIELVLQPEAHLVANLPHVTGNLLLAVVDGSGLPRTRPVAGPTVRVDGLNPGPCSVSLGFRREQRVQLVAGETATVDFSDGTKISGVVTVAGRPRPRAAVMLAEVGPGQIGAGGGVLTDAAGRYEIAGAASGSYVLIAVTAEGRAEKRIEVPDGGELQADLDVIERNLRVVVREHETGRPLPGSTVMATPSGALCTGFVQTSTIEDGIGYEISASNAGCTRVTTASDGVALLALGEAGPYALAIASRGFADWNRPIQVADGTTEIVAELVRGGPPTVRVLIDTLPPLVPGTLFCVQSGSNSSQAPVAGEAVCEGLNPGPAEVAFRADDVGLARARVDVPESGEATVTLEVPRAGRLVVPLPASASTVRVVDESGTTWNLPYGLGWPRCAREEGPGPAASYVCHELPPGTYTVDVDGKKRSPVPVRSGETAVAY